MKTSKFYINLADLQKKKKKKKKKEKKKKKKKKKKTVNSKDVLALFCWISS